MPRRVTEVVQHVDQDSGPTLDIRTFIGAEGEFVLVEDAGDGPPEGHETRRTRLSMRAQGKHLELFADLVESNHPGDFDILLLRISGAPGAPLSFERNGKEESVRENGLPDPADPSGFAWLREEGQLILAVQTAQMPQALTFTFESGLLAEDPPPLLEAWPAENGRQQGELMLAGTDHFVVSEFWQPCLASARLLASWSPAGLTIEGSAEHPEGIPFESTENANDDGLSVWWMRDGDETPVLARVGPPRPGALEPEVVGPDTDPEGLTGTFALKGPRLLVSLKIPAALLGHASLAKGLEILAGIRLKHSDRAGFQVRLEWTPGTDEKVPPRSCIRLAEP